MSRNGPVALCYHALFVIFMLAPIVVGAAPDYVRRRDVVKQLSLAAPGLPVNDSLEATTAAARNVIRSAVR